MQERDIFIEALQKESPADRDAYLHAACAADTELRTRVERLLVEHERQQSFILDAPAPGLGANLDPPILLTPPGTMIGRYKLLEPIGEGGYGAVFMAEQTSPVQRKVALKIIKAGMDTRQVIARFEAERQALALMDHPNIARVFDAGTTDTGRPYFVMELVKGMPITKYCDSHHIEPRQRLELFMQVCQAVQHAHQKGIIHRDIKPNNVLVAQYDGKPVPKVIDFGVAKATGQQLTERTMFTSFGDVIGTLEYMSPEQAEVNQLDVDTRSDIYSLGVLLYELLTGSTPLEHNRVMKAGLLEMLRVVREEEAPKPSMRLSTTKQLASISANRGVEPKKLSGLVKGELDWIVMKALEKNRARRYETANGLAADVQRYLSDEAVQACPPSARYRFAKFARRNKPALFTSVLVVASLLAGTAVATWQAVRATRANRVALAAAETAKAREAETRAVLDFVENKIFAAARPEGQAGGQGQDVTLRKAIEASLPFVEASFTNKPLIEARLRMTLGLSFSYLGEYRIAADQFEKARALYTQRLGPDHPDTLSSMHELAYSYDTLGRPDEALKLFEQTLAIQQATLGPDHPDTLATMNDLAGSYYALGRHADALKLREKTLALQKAKLGPEHPDTLRSMNNLAGSYDAVGRQADALKLKEQTLALMKAKLGPEHPDTLAIMSNLANSYNALGRRDEALKLREETLALRRAKLGPDHPDTLQSMTALANSYRALGRYAEALKLREETLALQKAKLGPDHPDTLMSMAALANNYSDVGRRDESLKLCEETLALMKAKLGPDHPDTLLCMHNLASNYEDFGRNDEALKLNEETLALRKAKLGPDHPDTLKSMTALAINYSAVGRQAEALKLREATLALCKAKLGPDHPDTLRSMSNLAISYSDVGRNDEALKLKEETLALRKAKLGPDDPDTLRSMNNLASSYSDVGRQADALKLREETLARRKAKLGPDHPDTLKSMNELAESYAALGRQTDALKLREETLALRTSKLGADHPDTIISMWAVAKSLIKLDRDAEAVPIIDECIRHTAGKDVRSRLIPDVMNLRLQHFEKITDAAGCLETAGKWEALKRTDAQSLYQSAYFRAVCAVVISETDKTPAGEAKTKEQAELSKAWLKQAVAAGYQSADHVEEDKSQPEDEQLRRFRTEAEELLKITDQNPTTKSELK